jgi:CubicO group peptidase (beta-lactamase class C family)
MFSGSILVAREGRVLLAKGYGLADRERGVPNTPATKFRIGSLTKAFTAAAVPLLQQDGKLDDDDLLERFIPDYPEGDRIFLRHLLSHTSGIANFTALPEYDEYSQHPTTLLRTIEQFRDLPLEFEPGSRFRYSNSNYILLAYVIEQVAGSTYGEFLRQRIFEPLGMNDTGYDHNDPALPEMARGYAFEADSGELREASYIDMTVPGGAGGLYSTVRNLLIWHQALTDDRLLTPASRALMFTPVRNGYGYGWGIQTAFADRLTISHQGGINGFLSVIWRFPDEDLVIVVLSNSISEETSRLMGRIPAVVLFDGGR